MECVVVVKWSVCSVWWVWNYCFLAAIARVLETKAFGYCIYREYTVNFLHNHADFPSRSENVFSNVGGYVRDYQIIAIRSNDNGEWIFSIPFISF